MHDGRIRGLAADGGTPDPPARTDGGDAAPTPDREDEDRSGIYARESGYLDRYVQLGIAGSKVISVSFPGTPEANARDDHALLDRIDRYLDGTNEEDFSDVAIGLTVPTERRSVLETVRTVPYGEQISVEQLAGMTPGLDADDDEDRRLVRTALAANPTPLFVPDHRVRDGPSAAPPSVEQRLRSLEGL